VAVEDLQRENPDQIAYTVDELYSQIQDWIYNGELTKKNA
jgi:uncharacterized short protein YbdD (DUF466 family)